LRREVGERREKGRGRERPSLAGDSVNDNPDERSVEIVTARGELDGASPGEPWKPPIDIVYAT